MYFLAAFILGISFVNGRECEVSEWSEWSQCFGDCVYGKIVRNRDVLVPPLPEADGSWHSQLCPYLYETHTCQPDFCQSVIEKDFPRPDEMPSTDSSEVTKPSAHELKRIEIPTKNSQNIEFLRDFTSTETERPMSKVSLEKMAQGEIMNDVLRQLETAVDLNVPLDDKHIKKALKKNRKLLKALVEAYRHRTSTTTEVSSSQSTTTSLPDTAAEKSSEETSSEIDQVDSQISINSVENQGPTTNVDISTTTGSDVSPITSTTKTSTSTKTAQHDSTIPYWKKKGFVPNSRKHASEITEKLYMTGEIVQVLSTEPIRRSPILNIDCMESNRCCRIERKICPDGSRPTLVKRYYRPRGASDCIPYHYPRCSTAEEMEEQPIEFVQNCQDLCFQGSEKRISPFYPL